MTLKFIYNESGVAESVVLPIELWQELKDLLKIKKENKPTKKFSPKDFRGAIKHLNLNIEDEIKQMRNEWKNSI